MSRFFILQIAVPTPLPGHFDYLPPKDYINQHLKPGVRVLVPFGRQQLVGILIGKAHSTEVPANKLKQVTQILDEEPIFSPHLLKLAHWLSDYYHHPIGEVMATLLPTLLRKGKAAKLPQQRAWKLVANTHFSPEQFKRKPKQFALLNTLNSEPTGMTETVLKQQGFTLAIVKNLATQGLIESVYQPCQVLLDILPHKDRETPLILNAEQECAVSSVVESLHHFQSFLLEGVTGSGKTEVYLHCIAAVLEQGKQALVLVPEISLTPQTVARFQRRFAQPTVVLHSGLNDTERMQAWLLAQQGQARIVIGTRSAIFTPLKNPGIIIIDEAHDSSFKQQDGLRYSARDLALVRGRMEHLPVVLGTATPSLESLHNVNLGRHHHLVLQQRAGDAKPPEFKIIDIRNQTLKEGLSTTLLNAIQERLDANEQVILFLNRRGYAPTLICHQCGWSASCKRCDARMTVHLSTHLLHCHHCDTQTQMLKVCPKCQGKQLLPLGLGTQRLEKILQQYFPSCTIARIDRDNTRKKNSLQQMLDAINAGEYQILIGTQMLAKGHHFPNVTLVAVIDADNGLFSSDFRALEHMAQLLMQVAGRAGRAEKKGTVLIQSRSPDHPLLSCLVEKGYRSFAEELLKERHAARLPPYAHFALFRAEAAQQNYPTAFLQELKTLIMQTLPSSVQLLGPIPAFMERRAGRYRALLLLQSSHRTQLQLLLRDLRKTISTIKLATKVRWSLDVDPLEIL